MPVTRRHTVNDRRAAIDNIPLQSTHCYCMNCRTAGGDRTFAAFQPTATEPDAGFGIWQHGIRHLAQQGVLP
jgi:hypothetical protein